MDQLILNPTNGILQLPSSGRKVMHHNFPLLRARMMEEKVTEINAESFGRVQNLKTKGGKKKTIKNIVLLRSLGNDLPGRAPNTPLSNIRTVRSSFRPELRTLHISRVDLGKSNIEQNIRGVDLDNSNTEQNIRGVDLGNYNTEQNIRGVDLGNCNTKQKIRGVDLGNCNTEQNIRRVDLGNCYTKQNSRGVQSF